MLQNVSLVPRYVCVNISPHLTTSNRGQKHCKVNSRLRRWRWKQGVEINNHFLMPSYGSCLIMVQFYREGHLKLLKLSNEGHLVLVHAILNGIKTMIIDQDQLLHLSTERTNLSK